MKIDEINKICVDAEMVPTHNGFIHPSKRLRLSIGFKWLTILEYVDRPIQSIYRPSGQWITVSRKGWANYNPDELWLILDQYITQIQSQEFT